ncbi:MAG TPA: hypothetical protein VHZ51_22185 [Ktedonobacteraceae bacterium]|nr:hypothetical protein [Ktedonobacteraceae bacterium]
MALFIILLSYFVVQPVLAPFDSVQVPPNCTTSLSHLPESRDYIIAGDGRGTLLAENTSTAVVVAADYGKAPFIAYVHVIDKASERIIQTFDFHNDIVDAGFDGDTLYLFNDKLGYFVDTKSGALLHNIIETDNYRGLFESNGNRFVQSDITVSAITSTWHLIVRHHFHMSSIAYGCYLP